VKASGENQDLLDAVGRDDLAALARIRCC